MKVRFVNGRVRVRVDDLELAALERGETLKVRVDWPGGGWSLVLDPESTRVGGEAGKLRVGVAGILERLGAPEREGVTLDGPPRVSVEKDFGPEHG